MDNDEINWEKNEPIIRKYGIQTWRNGKHTPEHLVSVTHTGVSLNNMLNEARADQKEIDASHEAKAVSDAIIKADKLARADEQEKFKMEKHNIEHKATEEAIKKYPLMKKTEEEAIRADTANQIFKEFGDIIAFSGKLTELRSDKVYRAVREEDYLALKKNMPVGGVMYFCSIDCVRAYFR